jgi:preprotein translocase subunit SecB
MVASKIQMDQYFLSSFNYSVNPDFDPEKNVHIRFADISESHEIQPLNDETLKEWQVDLKVGFGPSGDSNAPYSFTSHIVGIFVVIDDLSKEGIPAFVNANATSVLYSTLREIVHTITSKGPYFPLLLPTPCFHQQTPECSTEE